MNPLLTQMRTYPFVALDEAPRSALAGEEHVQRMRRIYAAQRELFAHKGIRVAGCDATFYLWWETPDGQTTEAFAARLLENGVMVAPGSFFGECGEGYFRLALVPTVEDCQRAVAILEEVL